MILLTLITVLHLLHAQEIKFESLDNGPGILPFELGSTALTTHYHTFLQYIDLDNIENKVQLMYSQHTQIMSKLDDEISPYFAHQLKYFISRLDKAQNKLKSLESNRGGLTDGPGPVIKSISGNLDYTDAKKCDDALYNKDNLTSEVNSHISVSKDLMSRYSKILTNILEIQSNIDTLLTALKDSRNDRKIFKLGHILSIGSTNIDELSNELSRIEDITAFTHASRTHHSMLGKDSLTSMLSTLKYIYGSNQVMDLDYWEYYNIIRSGSYYVDKRLVIVLRFPIISPHEYILYKLAILPNKNNQVLIPPYPFIAINKNNHVYLNEAECPKLSNRYLCEEKLNYQIRTEPDCILKLINNQTVDKSCQMTTLSFVKEAMEKLDDQHYTLIFPHPTKTHLICERDEYSVLNGSYLATVPPNCRLRTKEFTIANVNNKIKGIPMKIIQTSFEISPNKPNSPPLKILSINLKDLYALQHRVELQEQIHPESVHTQALYHTTIPIYGIILSALLILVILRIRRYRNHKRSYPVDCQNQVPEPNFEVL